MVDDDDVDVNDENHYEEKDVSCCGRRLRR